MNIRWKIFFFYDYIVIFSAKGFEEARIGNSLQHPSFQMQYLWKGE